MSGARLNPPAARSRATVRAVVVAVGRAGQEARRIGGEDGRQRRRHGVREFVVLDPIPHVEDEDAARPQHATGLRERRRPCRGRTSRRTGTRRRRRWRPGTAAASHPPDATRRRASSRPPRRGRASPDSDPWRRSTRRRAARLPAPASRPPCRRRPPGRAKRIGPPAGSPGPARRARRSAEPDRCRRGSRSNPRTPCRCRSRASPTTGAAPPSARSGTSRCACPSPGRTGDVSALVSYSQVTCTCEVGVIAERRLVEVELLPVEVPVLEVGRAGEVRRAARSASAGGSRVRACAASRATRSTD